MNNGQYYFEKTELRKLSRKDGASYCYVSPETRSYMVTDTGAPLLPGEYDWQRIEERIATGFFNFELYNPTTEEITPDRNESRYDRFFEMVIKAKLFTELEKYRRVYTALGISFTPKDRNGLKKTSSSEYTEESSGETKFGKTNTSTNTPTGSETTKTVTDTGAQGNGDAVVAGDVSKSTKANTAFDTGAFADVDKSTETVITPARIVSTVTNDAGTRQTVNSSTDGGTDEMSGEKSYTLDGEEIVTGWSNFDIETSVKSNLEIAKTTLAKMIIEDIVSCIICGLYREKPTRAKIPDFIIEKILWGEYDEIAWDELKGTWKGVSENEIYD